MHESVEIAAALTAAQNDNSVSRILVIEDDPAAFMLVEDMVATYAPGRFHLSHSSRLADGIASLRDDAFDLVLLDLGLPDSAGLMSLERLRAEVYVPPVVILTGLHDEDAGLDAIGHGAQDYLFKDGIDGPALVRALTYAATRERTRRLVEEGDFRAERRAIRGRVDDGEPLSIDSNAFAADYAKLLRDHVGQSRLGDAGQSPAVTAFAHVLAEKRPRALDVVDLHLGALDALAQSPQGRPARRVARESRLLLLELFGRLMNIYRGDTPPQ